MSFDVLHVLALRRKADLAALAKASGRSEAELEAALAPAIADGRVIKARALYVLAPAGANWLQEEYPRAFSDARSDERLSEEYARFEQVNRDLKALVTMWQSMPVGGEMVPNDHSDADYDADLIDRLGDLHERAEQLIGRMAERVPRLSRYAGRLAEALEQAEDGAHEWVSSVRCDSYHTVWFEMHEDLLRLLDRQREE